MKRSLFLIYNHVLTWVVVYDLWCSFRVEEGLLWLEEWFSLRQLQTEKILMVIYIVCQLIGPHGFLWRVPGVLLVGGFIYFMHRLPLARRGYWRRALLLGGSHVALAIRPIVQVLYAVVSCVDLRYGSYPWSELSLIANFCFVILYYSTEINLHDDDRRGRRRKLALANLKELFGTEWIAKPLPVPR